MVGNQVVSWTFRAQPLRAARRYTVLGVALAFALVLLPLKLGVVRGHSMSPSLHSGAMYLMDRSYFRTHPIKRDEILVFKRNGESYIKRVLAAPGDMVYVLRHKNADSDELVGDWQLPLIRRAMARRPWKDSMKLVAIRLPQDQYYMIGDNVGDSVDSRNFGPINLDQVQGRVLFAPPSIPDLEHFAGNFQSERKS